MKTTAHAVSDQSSVQDSDQSGEGNSSDGEGSASSPTADGSSGEVIAMSRRDQACAQEEAVETRVERQWIQHDPDKLQHGGVRPWFAQACATTNKAILPLGRLQGCCPRTKSGG